MNRLTDIKILLQEIDNTLKQKFPINQIQQGWQVLIFYGLSDSLYNSTMQKINEFEKKYGYKFEVYVYPYWGKADILETMKLKIQNLLNSWQSNIQNLNFELFDDTIVSLIVDNHCSTAVFEAFKYIETTVREKGGYAKTEKGVPLMRKAFNKDNGPLINAEWTDAEKEAIAQLFAGAIGFMKNPSSHHMINIKKSQALEMLNFAHYLLRILSTVPIQE